MNFINTGNLEALAAELGRPATNNILSTKVPNKGVLKFPLFDSPLHASASYTHKIASPQNKRFENMMMKRMMSGEFKVKKSQDKKNNKKQSMKVVFRGSSWIIMQADMRKKER